MTGKKRVTEKQVSNVPDKLNDTHSSIDDSRSNCIVNLILLFFTVCGLWRTFGEGELKGQKREKLHHQAPVQ